MRSNIGICGHFNIGSDAVGGQTIKTRIISETLSEVYGADDVQTLDTANWKRKAPLFFFQCIRLALGPKILSFCRLKMGSRC